MPDITGFVINIILFVGACLLVVSFVPIQKLISQIPEGTLRKKWNDLRALILFFIAGYACFSYLFWMERDEDLHFIVPAVFFLGAVLVLFVGKLALETTSEVHRVSALQYENITDHLTGINNRRYLDRRITEEISRARRYGTALSMLLLDIDHFKSVNDTYGHQIGDHVLQSLGQLLFKSVRNTDLVARYGGEEIAVLCPQTPVSQALDFAERLRQKIEAAIMVPADEYVHRQEITITISMGVAGFDEQVTDNQALIRRVDEALYKAKTEGRNRVVLFQNNEA